MFLLPHFLDVTDLTAFTESFNSVYFSNRIIIFGKPQLFINLTNTKASSFPSIALMLSVQVLLMPTGLIK